MTASGLRPTAAARGVLVLLSATVMVALGLPAADAAPTPRVTGVSPSSSDYAAKPVITVTGSGFADGDTVVLSDSAYNETNVSAVAVSSSSSLHFTAPEIEVGRYHLQVNGASGLSAKTSAGSHPDAPRAPNNPGALVA